MSFVVYNNHRIAKGSFSTVYRGLCAETDEDVAIKVFEASVEGNVLFQNEAALLETMPQHSNLVRFAGVGQFDDRQFIALEFFPHPTLAEYLHRRGPLPDEEALSIVEQLLETISFLASHGIAHRDIKPANILIDPRTRRIKVIDFGLSSPLPHGMRTRSCSYVGTPHYMAPQVLARNSRISYATIAADCWSVGVVLWELLLGAHPFLSAQSREQMQSIVLSTFDFSCFSSLSQRLLASLLQVDEGKRSDPTAAIAMLAERKKPLENCSTEAMRAIKMSRADSRRFTHSRKRSISH